MKKNSPVLFRQLWVAIILCLILLSSASPVIVTKAQCGGVDQPECEDKEKEKEKKKPTKTLTPAPSYTYTPTPSSTPTSTFTSTSTPTVTHTSTSTFTPTLTESEQAAIDSIQAYADWLESVQTCFISSFEETIEWFLDNNEQDDSFFAPRIRYEGQTREDFEDHWEDVFDDCLDPDIKNKFDTFSWFNLAILDFGNWFADATASHDSFVDFLNDQTVIQSAIDWINNAFEENELFYTPIELRKGRPPQETNSDDNDDEQTYWEDWASMWDEMFTVLGKGFVWMGETFVDGMEMIGEMIGSVFSNIGDSLRRTWDAIFG